MFLLNETEMGQNNSVFVFVRKTWKCSHRRPNLIIDMNHVTNLKSLGLHGKNDKYTESLHKFLIPIFLLSSVLCQTVLQSYYMYQFL